MSNHKELLAKNELVEIFGGEEREIGGGLVTGSITPPSDGDSGYLFLTGGKRVGEIRDMPIPPVTRVVTGV